MICFSGEHRNSIPEEKFYLARSRVYNMKPLFMQLAEERLKGQPPRHAKAYKDDISSFEADMLVVATCLSRRPYKGLGEIAQETGIAKSTLQKLLTSKGIRRTFNLKQLERLRERNVKRYLKILQEHSGVLIDGNGRWRGLVYRNSDLERFRLWLIERGYMLLSRPEIKGKSFYYVIPAPKDVLEEMRALYEYRHYGGEFYF